MGNISTAKELFLNGTALKELYLNGNLIWRSKSYLCEVEYLQQTALNQWIETDFYPDYSKNFEITVYGAIAENANQRHILLGTHSTGSNATADLNLETPASSSLRYYTPIKGTACDYTVGTYTLNTPFKMVAKWNASTKTMMFTSNDTTTQTKTFTTDTNTTTLNPIWFFNDQRTESKVSQAGTRLYRVSYIEEGTQILDIIPVLDFNETPCLFNKVDNSLMYNAGTDTTAFAYGRRIYEVEYLESDGNQYIDTSVVSSNAIDFEVDVKSTNSGQFHCFGYWNDANNRFAVFNSSSASLGIQFAYGDGATNNMVTSGVQWSNRHTVALKNKIMYVDGVVVKSASYNLTNGGNMWFGAINDLAKHACYLYSCKIWNDGVLVRNFIPAIDENNVGFMFDRVNHKIYDNAGTGAFSYGEIKEKPYKYEVEYIGQTELGDQTECPYIELPFVPTVNTRCEVKTFVRGFSVAKNGGGAGCRTDLTMNSRYFIVANNADGNGLRFVLGDKTLNYTTSFNQMFEIDFNNNKKVTVNGTDVGTFSGMTYTTGDLTQFTYFKMDNPTYSHRYKMSADLYYLKFYADDNTTLIYDLIPVLDYNNKPCLYDKINNKLYYNAGIGEFSYGGKV